MSIITLANLAEAATGTVSRGGRTPFYAVEVVEARSYVIIKDGNRKPAEDGSQKLTLVIGKHTLPMDCIKPGTSRIAVTVDQIEGYTEALEGALNDGLFDAAIVQAQALAKAQAEKAKAPKAVAVEVEATEGLDLDALEAGDSEVSDEL